MRLYFSVLIFATFGVAGCFVVPGTPEAAFHEFQTTQTKESYIVLPLCSAGEKVVPLVSQRIKDKDLARRRYAIGFLGVYGNSETIPILKSVLADESELVYFRGDALGSLFVLDERSGRLLADTHRARTDYLGEQAKRITVVDDAAAYREEYRRRICEPDD